LSGKGKKQKRKDMGVEKNRLKQNKGEKESEE
jgi:hypothetical protein